MSGSKSSSAAETPVELLERLKTSRYERPRAECDMVMKGGITSGVIYPLAVCSLAQKYRLRNVGGTSAGAIAAAAAAAAEKGRESRGFNKLAELPDEIGGKLTSLFQAQRGTYPLMKILLASMAKRSPTRRSLGVLWAALSAQPLWFWGGALLVLVPTFASIVIAAGLPSSIEDWKWIARGFVPSVPLALLAALIGVAIGLGLKLMKKLPENYFGLASGMEGHKSKGQPALTDWLTEKIDSLADQRDRPLTFGDLWGPAAVAAYDRAKEEKRGPSLSEIKLREIHLEMMTTDLARGRPWRIPFSERRFYYCPVEFTDLFPASVVGHLRRHSNEVTDDEGRSVECPNHRGTILRKLPPTPDLPVVVAARMSLSFPVLISAIPLYSYDRTFPGKQGEDDEEPEVTPEKAEEPQPLVRCWFSDGGMSSNFPIHFFDGLWPSRPTFGINLAKYHPKYPDSHVYHPEVHGGRELRVRAIPSLFAFFAAIADTMQNWADRGQMTLPGYRDRIVTVHHTKDEGGMNLTMDPETIAGLAGRGALAGETLNDHFTFSKHRGWRFRLAMAELEDVLEKMKVDYRIDLPDGPAYQAFLPACLEEAGLPEWWRASAVTKTSELMAFVESLPGDDGFTFTFKRPRPDPDLRITPRF